MGVGARLFYEKARTLLGEPRRRDIAGSGAVGLSFCEGELVRLPGKHARRSVSFS